MEKIELMFHGTYFTVEFVSRYSQVSECNGKNECCMCSRKPRRGWNSSIPYDSIEVISITRSSIEIDKSSYQGLCIIKEIKKLEKKVVCINCCGRFSLIAHILPGSY